MNIIAVDDEPFALSDLEEVLSECIPNTPIHTFDNTEDALAYAKENIVDIAFLDIEMNNTTGIQLAQMLLKIHEKTNIIFVTGYSEYALEAFSVYASGYILKGSSIGELSSAIRIAYGGGALINPGIATKVISQFSAMAKGNEVIHVDEASAADLNDNERKIIKAVGHGMSNREISGKLYLSEGTVRNYISNILLKLGLRDRTQLAIWAVQNGMAMQDSDWNG